MNEHEFSWARVGAPVYGMTDLGFWTGHNGARCGMNFHISAIGQAWKSF
ncbi:MAG: hypothetical protein M8467_05625 [Anaerolineae bacterium]|nr:hypothetical protein [Anaerolineae bacterium]